MFLCCNKTSEDKQIQILIGDHRFNSIVDYKYHEKCFYTILLIKMDILYNFKDPMLYKRKFTSCCISVERNSKVLH